MNIQEKENNPEFAGDLEAILRPEINYNQNEAFRWLRNELIERM